MFVLPLFAALAGDVAILDVSVQRESHDEVELAIAYRLTGVREEAHVGAITMFGGSSALHWAYSPATLELGTHSAVVTVKRGPDAPPVYRSDAFKIQVFGGLDHEHDFPYDKLWCDQAACDDSLLVEVQSAPFEERLTSIFPSIRVAAEAEAETLDDEAKRALMPGITERIRHTNVWIRLRALRVLGDWGLNDPALTVPIVEAMSDPHPGVSRTATSIAWKTADPMDPLVEDALSRALHSPDESTRHYAEEGLKYMSQRRKLALKPKLEGPTPESENACGSAGGDWGLFGLYRIPQCNLPTPDAGNVCTDSVECISACVFETPGGTSGTCFAWTIVRGNCLNFVEDGKVKGTICVD